MTIRLGDNEDYTRVISYSYHATTRGWGPTVFFWAQDCCMPCDPIGNPQAVEKGQQTAQSFPQILHHIRLTQVLEGLNHEKVHVLHPPDGI